MDIVYLDNSATTMPCKESAEAVKIALSEDYFNPSAVYSGGVSVYKKIEEYRSYIAKTLGAKSEEITFTSGGSESTNTAIMSAAHSSRKHTIITSMMEHHATLNTVAYLKSRGYNVKYLKPDKNGVISEKQVSEALDEDTFLVSLMHVNNEIGSVNDIHSIACTIKNYDENIIFHVDAVQSYLKEPLNVRDFKVDFLSISGHKIHALKGIGIMYHRSGIHVKPLIYGGGQEQGVRSGTENVPGIYSLGEAVKKGYLNFESNVKHMQNLRKYLKDLITSKIHDINVISPENGVCHILNVSFHNVRGEVLLHALEEKHIYVSTGSACSSKKSSSHVLTALNLSDAVKDGAIRFSLSEYNTYEEIHYAVEELELCVEKIREIMNLRGKR